jgi:5-methylcytosine-specific restriction protein A
MEDIEVNAGQLHRIVGGYPGSHHRMPTCCKVMKAAMMPSADYIVASPLKGMGASLTIRYAIPRQC